MMTKPTPDQLIADSRRVMQALEELLATLAGYVGDLQDEAERQGDDDQSAR